MSVAGRPPPQGASAAAEAVVQQAALQRALRASQMQELDDALLLDLCTAWKTMHGFNAIAEITPFRLFDLEQAVAQQQPSFLLVEVHVSLITFLIKDAVAKVDTSTTRGKRGALSAEEAAVVALEQLKIGSWELVLQDLLAHNLCQDRGSRAGSETAFLLDRRRRKIAVDRARATETREASWRVEAKAILSGLLESDDAIDMIGPMHEILGTSANELAGIVDELISLGTVYDRLCTDKPKPYATLDDVAHDVQRVCDNCFACFPLDSPQAKAAKRISNLFDELLTAIEVGLDEEEETEESEAPAGATGPPGVSPAGSAAGRRGHQEAESKDAVTTPTRKKRKTKARSTAKKSSQKSKDGDDPMGDDEDDVDEDDAQSDAQSDADADADANENIDKDGATNDRRASLETALAALRAKGYAELGVLERTTVLAWLCERFIETNAVREHMDKALEELENHEARVAAIESKFGDENGSIREQHEKRMQKVDQDMAHIRKLTKKWGQTCSKRPDVPGVGLVGRTICHSVEGDLPFRCGLIERVASQREAERKNRPKKTAATPGRKRKRGRKPGRPPTKRKATAKSADDDAPVAATLTAADVPTMTAADIVNAAMPPASADANPEEDDNEDDDDEDDDEDFVGPAASAVANGASAASEGGPDQTSGQEQSNESGGFYYSVSYDDDDDRVSGRGILSEAQARAALVASDPELGLTDRNGTEYTRYYMFPVDEKTPGEPGQVVWTTFGYGVILSVREGGSYVIQLRWGNGPDPALGKAYLQREDVRALRVLSVELRHIFEARARRDLEEHKKTLESTTPEFKAQRAQLDRDMTAMSHRLRTGPTYEHQDLCLWIVDTVVLVENQNKGVRTALRTLQDLEKVAAGEAASLLVDRGLCTRTESSSVDSFLQALQRAAAQASVGLREALSKPDSFLAYRNSHRKASELIPPLLSAIPALSDDERLSELEGLRHTLLRIEGNIAPLCRAKYRLEMRKELLGRLQTVGVRDPLGSVWVSREPFIDLLRAAEAELVASMGDVGSQTRSLVDKAVEARKGVNVKAKSEATATPEKKTTIEDLEVQEMKEGETAKTQETKEGETSKTQEQMAAQGSAPNGTSTGTTASGGPEDGKKAESEAEANDETKVAGQVKAEGEAKADGETKAGEEPKTEGEAKTDGDATANDAAKPESEVVPRVETKADTVKEEEGGKTTGDGGKEARGGPWRVPGLSVSGNLRTRFLRKWLPVRHEWLSVLNGSPAIAVLMHLAQYLEQAVRVLLKDLSFGKSCGLFEEKANVPPNFFQPNLGDRVILDLARLEYTCRTEAADHLAARKHVCREAAKPRDAPHDVLGMKGFTNMWASMIRFRPKTSPPVLNLQVYATEYFPGGGEPYCVLTMGNIDKMDRFGRQVIPGQPATVDGHDRMEGTFCRVLSCGRFMLEANEGYCEEHHKPAPVQKTPRIAPPQPAPPGAATKGPEEGGDTAVQSESVGEGKMGENGGATKASTPPEEDSACFICKDGGHVFACDEVTCPKVFHLDCMQMSSMPLGSWSCPLHDTSGDATLRAFNRLLLNITGKVLSMPASEPFVHPVSGQAGYSEVVSRPICLREIRLAALHDRYRSQKDFLDEAELLAANCHAWCDERFPQLPPLADRVVYTAKTAVRREKDALDALEAKIPSEAEMRAKAEAEAAAQKEEKQAGGRGRGSRRKSPVAAPAGRQGRARRGAAIKARSAVQSSISEENGISTTTEPKLEDCGTCENCRAHEESEVPVLKCSLLRCLSRAAVDRNGPVIKLSTPRRLMLESMDVSALWSLPSASGRVYGIAGELERDTLIMVMPLAARVVTYVMTEDAWRQYTIWDQARQAALQPHGKQPQSQAGAQAQAQAQAQLQAQQQQQQQLLQQQQQRARLLAQQQQQQQHALQLQRQRQQSHPPEQQPQYGVARQHQAQHPRHVQDSLMMQQQQQQHRGPEAQHGTYGAGAHDGTQSRGPGLGQNPQFANYGRSPSHDPQQAQARQYAEWQARQGQQQQQAPPGSVGMGQGATPPFNRSSSDWSHHSGDSRGSGGHQQNPHARAPRGAAEGPQDRFQFMAQRLKQLHRNQTQELQMQYHKEHEKLKALSSSMPPEEFENQKRLFQMHWQDRLRNLVAKQRAEVQELHLHSKQQQQQHSQQDGQPQTHGQGQGQFAHGYGSRPASGSAGAPGQYGQSQHQMDLMAQLQQQRERALQEQQEQRRQQQLLKQRQEEILQMQSQQQQQQQGQQYPYHHQQPPHEPRPSNNGQHPHAYTGHPQEGSHQSQYSHHSQQTQGWSSNGGRGQAMMQGYDMHGAPMQQHQPQHPHQRPQ